MSAETPADRRTSNRILGLVVAVVLALLVGAWLLVAAVSYQRSFSAEIPLVQRADFAQAAGTMEPWNRQYTTRALVMEQWQRGAALLADGDYNGAIAALDIAYRNDIGDEQLLALYHKAQDTQALATNRKAHLQHGHEGPGGTLTEQQIER